MIKKTKVDHEKITVLDAMKFMNNSLVGLLQEINDNLDAIYHEMHQQTDYMRLSNKNKESSQD